MALMLSSAMPAAAEVVQASFTSASEVPVSAAGYAATGHQVSLSLHFAPEVGTNLMVVRNTGRNLIQGTFSNLSQGQRVTLDYGGIKYPFVANYYGGTGNDLELQWANSRLVSWGSNVNGQLGDGTRKSRLSPGAVHTPGTLKGKTPTAITTGAYHSLALYADGTLAAWGNSSNGQLGLGSLAVDQLVPAPMNGNGSLAGKTAIAIAAGYGHSLALCSDGTLSAWGFNSAGQLGVGEGTTFASLVPMPVDLSGSLAGRQLMSISSGQFHNLALCTDGSMHAWGYNGNGELGIGTLTNTYLPTRIPNTPVLSGRIVDSIRSDDASNLVLCADGTLAAWGYNGSGALGDNSTVNRSTPVLVDRSGVLSGRTVIAVDHGGTHGIALCSDGTIATWGSNSLGALGTNSTASSSVPVQVVNTGVLAGKTVTKVSAGGAFNMALCSDGNLAAWGYNADGRLGINSTTNMLVPVLVDRSTLRTGERFVDVFAGRSHAVAVVASPPEPTAATLPATGITDTGVVLNGLVDAEGRTTDCVFEYGLTTDYGTTVTASPATMTGISPAEARATISGLSPGTTYHYRMLASSDGGSVAGENMTFTTTNAATLSGLEINPGTFWPGFSGSQTEYFVTVSFASDRISIHPTALDPSAGIRINSVVADGSAGTSLPLAVGRNDISVEVAAPDGVNTVTYRITVHRLPEVFAFQSASHVPFACGELMASGNTITFSLDFSPQVGTELTVVNNTGNELIRGEFDNLSHGQVVVLPHSGVSYPFIADYFGGTGNDLVLRWANTRLFSWGFNAYGQLGDGTTTNGRVPKPSDLGSLQGRRVVHVATGSNFSLALCSDGTLHSWGQNTSGQLGSNGFSNRSVPGLVVQTGVLAGKTIIDMAAGTDHAVVLCADGSLVSWGANTNGQLGNGGTVSSRVPILVDRSGALAGRKVAAVETGASHTVVLCQDGGVVAWGSNVSGQLGIGLDFGNRATLPVSLDSAGALAGRKVTAIAAANLHNLALCDDGSLVAWGVNGSGQLGNGTTTSSSEPILIPATGALVGRTITAIAAGSVYSMGLCSDGAIASWGNNTSGQLGNGSTVGSPVPVLVNKSGVLAGGAIVQIDAGPSHGMARLENGFLAAWGANNAYQLGNNSTANSSVPTAVNTGQLWPGERFVRVAAGGHTLALTAYAPPPAVTTLGATGIQETAATPNGRVHPAGASVTVAFEYGLTNSFGNVASGIPSTASGNTPVMVAANLAGLSANTTYHYRLVVTDHLGGITTGETMTFTTSRPPVFPGYAVSTPFGKPVSVSIRKLLAKASDPDGDSISVTSMASVSDAGGAVALGQSDFQYTPAAGFSGEDRFSVVVSDRWGASTTGVVIVTVGSPPDSGDLGTNPPKVTLLENGHVALEFRAIPGRAYQIQRSGDVKTWTTIASVNADRTGLIQYIDDDPPQPSAFYRLAVP